MRPIDHFNLRSFDLNLLVAFDVLMVERSVTKAAARLRIQQPAMSHTLATLRILLDDPLFIRVGTTMRPTTRAQVLAPRIRNALANIQNTLQSLDPFTPETETRTFRLGFSSEVEILTMPGLTARFLRDAPHASLLGRTVPADHVHRLLDDREIDLAIGCFTQGTTRHHSRMLYEQTLACCFNPALLPLSLPITPETYIKTPHALMTMRDDLQGCLSQALARIGATLNITLAAGDFLTILSTAARAPVIATLPERMARRHAASFGLTVIPVPLDLRVPAVSMVWSAQQDRDPASLWLRDAVTTLLTA